MQNVVRRAGKLLAAGIGAGRLLVACTPARVHGSSMSPTFEDGDRLAVRPPFAYEPTQGQIVVADLGDREVVKRVTARDKDSVFLEGDNRAASTDPGFVNRSQIKAVVIVRYWPLVR